MAKVLIVDDETSLRELLYDFFSRKGFAVLTANSGSQALVILKTHRPDCILLDLGMPGDVSGLEAVKRIRVVDDAVPVICMHGSGDPELGDKELKRLAILEVLRKELGIELFLKSLEASIRRLQEKAKHTAEVGVRVPGAVLVVDDDPGIVKLLNDFLASRGLKVLTATSGEEAVAALAHKPVTVLLDMTMPGMDGLMTLQKIKATHPRLPVIMVSGIGDEATVQEALDAGAYDYVTKPFNLEYLETMVLTKILLGIEA